MAANIETMFSVRETPWHNQGIVIKEAPTSEEAIKIAQLDWDVVGNPIYDGDGNLIPGYKLNTRTSDNKALGVVTDKYPTLWYSKLMKNITILELRKQTNRV